LIRNLDVASHVVRIGDERVAVRVCHDLAAWSPRGNAVAKGGRAEAWEGMQAAAPGGLRTRTNNKRDWGEWRVCRRFLGHTEPRRRRPARGHLVGARGLEAEVTSEPVVVRRANAAALDGQVCPAGANIRLRVQSLTQGQQSATTRSCSRARARRAASGGWRLGG
jgi:hypothetical protein